MECVPIAVEMIVYPDSMSLIPEKDIVRGFCFLITIGYDFETQRFATPARGSDNQYYVDTMLQRMEESGVSIAPQCTPSRRRGGGGDPSRAEYVIAVAIAAGEHNFPTGWEKAYLQRAPEPEKRTTKSLLGLGGGGGEAGGDTIVRPGVIKAMGAVVDGTSGVVAGAVHVSEEIATSVANFAEGAVKVLKEDAEMVAVAAEKVAVIMAGGKTHDEAVHLFTKNQYRRAPVQDQRELIMRLSLMLHCDKACERAHFSHRIVGKLTDEAQELKHKVSLYDEQCSLPAPREDSFMRSVVADGESLDFVVRGMNC